MLTVLCAPGRDQQKFREQILHRTCFVFWAYQDDGDWQREVPVVTILEEIGDLLDKLNCITSLSAGTLTCRARGHVNREDSRGWGATDLGTNTPQRATTATRMSPAGIPQFYGAENTDTALAEVSRTDTSEFFTVGQFRTTAPITVLDLTRVPPVPSIFDPELGQWQGEIEFLNDLVEELRQPVDEGRGIIDYVPTQVFCEYSCMYSTRSASAASCGNRLRQATAAHAKRSTCHRTITSTPPTERRDDRS